MSDEQDSNPTKVGEIRLCSECGQPEFEHPVWFGYTEDQETEPDCLEFKP